MTKAIEAIEEIKDRIEWLTSEKNDVVTAYQMPANKHLKDSLAIQNMMLSMELDFLKDLLIKLNN